MGSRVRLACQPEIIVIPVAQILPLRRLEASVLKSDRYQRIAASIREVGVIEPIVVFPQNGGASQYMLLDGHVRLEVLKELGHQDAECLVATDDESFTYNHKVNQLPPIQEHFMILKAISKGVSEERIAKSLNVDVALIRRKRDLLDGICPEAVELLKRTRISAAAIREMRRVKPMRQIEMTELMCAANNYSASYAKCLLIATPLDQQLEPVAPKETNCMNGEDVSRMEREMESLSQDFRMIEESHGRNTLNLVLVVGYLKKLLDNARVVRCMSQRHVDILAEFQRIAEIKSLSPGE